MTFRQVCSDYDFDIEGAYKAIRKNEKLNRFLERNFPKTDYLDFITMNLPTPAVHAIQEFFDRLSGESLNNKSTKTGSKESATAKKGVDKNDTVSKDSAKTSGSGNQSSKGSRETGQAQKKERAVSKEEKKPVQRSTKVSDSSVSVKEAAPEKTAKSKKEEKKMAEAKKVTQEETKTETKRRGRPPKAEAKVEAKEDAKPKRAPKKEASEPKKPAATTKKETVPKAKEAKAGVSSQVKLNSSINRDGYNVLVLYGEPAEYLFEGKYGAIRQVVAEERLIPLEKLAPLTDEQMIAELRKTYRLFPLGYGKQIILVKK